jgi:hypothetical protein
LEELVEELVGVPVVSVDTHTSARSDEVFVRVDVLPAAGHALLANIDGRANNQRSRHP